MSDLHTGAEYLLVEEEYSPAEGITLLPGRFGSPASIIEACGEEADTDSPGWVDAAQALLRANTKATAVRLVPILGSVNPETGKYIPTCNLEHQAAGDEIFRCASDTQKICKMAQGSFGGGAWERIKPYDRLCLIHSDLQRYGCLLRDPVNVDVPVIVRASDLGGMGASRIIRAEETR